MTDDINDWTLSGEVHPLKDGGTIEIRVTTNNHEVLKFKVMCVQHFKGKPYSRLVNVTAWNDKALELQNVEKGTFVILNGSFKEEPFEPRNGPKRWIPVLEVRKVVFTNARPAPAPRRDDTGPSEPPAASRVDMGDIIDLDDPENQEL